MIELRNISKTFNRNDSNAVSALDDVSLTIREKSFVVVVGSNGSGKSTLLNVIAGTLSADKGQILIDNKELSRLPDYRRSKWVARIFQNPMTGTSPELTVLENFRLASLRTKPKKFQIGTGDSFRSMVKERIQKIGLNLEYKLDQPMGNLSGGQRQALTLLMASMDETKILLMDEATAALDPKTSELILQVADRIIRESGLTVLFVTHQLKDALRYGDRIIRMNEGKIMQDYDKEAKARLTLADVYGWFE